MFNKTKFKLVGTKPHMFTMWCMQIYIYASTFHIWIRGAEALQTLQCCSFVRVVESSTIVLSWGRISQNSGTWYVNQAKCYDCKHTLQNLCVSHFTQRMCSLWFPLLHIVPLHVMMSVLTYKQISGVDLCESLSLSLFICIYVHT